MIIGNRLISLAAAFFMAASCCRPAAENPDIVPFPQNVELKCGAFNAAGADIRYTGDADTAVAALAMRFADRLSLVTGQESRFISGHKGNGVNLIRDTSLSGEAYVLEVGRRRVILRASSLRGFNWGLQTFRQMLPPAVYGDSLAAGEDWSVPCCRISDSPRFGYRGLHLDVARHFFGVDMVKRYIDIMEIHKLNTLHWHLTDDQGWRVQIRKYPELTGIGSIRRQTLVGHLDSSSVYDGKPYGEGMWYTQDQIREVVSYAAARGITVIPEIDLPGHMVAALAAYPELGCTGGPYEVWQKWGISDDVLCVGRESTMEFLEDVLSEICELFPSEYIHIGGDECPKVRWAHCPYCQKKIAELGLKDDGKYSAEHYLQSYVSERMEKFLAERGRRIIAWDEILEGQISPDATVMSWRGTSGGQEAARLGHDVIMTPYEYLYLDYYQSEERENEPLAIGGYVPVEKCYSFEPFTADMTDEQKAHILGVQANMWTEYISGDDHLEYMLLPRLAALSEVQWCQPGNRSWERFLGSAPELCARYDAAGYTYAKHILGNRE